MKLRFYRKTRTFKNDDVRHCFTDRGDRVLIDGTYQSMIVTTRDGLFTVEFVVVGGQAHVVSAWHPDTDAFDNFVTDAKKLILERGHVAGLRVPKRESTFAHKAQAEEVAKLIAREMAWENRP